MRREDLSAPTLEAARSLLGALLVREPDEGARHGRRVGRIVEVEAYIGEEDLASHARFGRTARNAPMYGPPGIAYVYRIYGMYDCLNVVTEPEGRPAAVLIRAVEPTEGVDAMRQARIARASRRGPPRSARLETLAEVELAAGPGLVAAAFGIDLTDTGLDLFHDRSRIHLERGWEPPEIVTTPRLGIDYAAEPWRSNAWRFIDPSSPAVSGPRSRR